MENPVHRSVTLDGWMDRSKTRGVILGSLAVLFIACLLAFFFFKGLILLLVLPLAGFLFVALTYRQPLPAILLLMLLSTNVLQFVDDSALPYVPLGPAGRLNAQDLVCLMLLGVAMLHLHQRRERPLFLTPLLVLGAMVAISFVVGLTAGTTDVKSGVNGLRSLSGYLFYIGLVGTVDTPRRLRYVVWMVFAFAVVSVCLQLVEASRGERLLSFTSSRDPLLITVDGRSVPYLINRCTEYLAIALFLALGYALRRHSLPHAGVALIALLGFGVAMVRQWYVYIVVGLFVMIIVAREHRLRLLLSVSLIFVALALVVNVLGSGILSSGYPFVDVWLGRISTLLHYQQESTIMSRKEVYEQVLRLFFGSPFFGHGPGSISRFPQGPAGLLADIGMPNTLLFYGFLGWTAVIVLIGVVLRRAYMLVDAPLHYRGHGYAAGLVGAWVCFTVAYATGNDFYSTSTFGVGLAMACVDRLSLFSASDDDEAGPPSEGVPLDSSETGEA